MTDKNQWRAHFKEEWARLMIDQKSFAEQRLALLINLNAFLKTQSGIWSSYQALPSEISLAEIPSQAMHLKWVYPKVSGQDLRFYSPGPHGFEATYQGISEPVDHTDEVAVKDISGFLIPGLGFDQSGVRLGKGKGFFDRALADVNGIKVGITLSVFQVTSLPHEPHDVKMDVVVTEKGVWTKWN